MGSRCPGTGCQCRQEKARMAMVPGLCCRGSAEILGFVPVPGNTWGHLRWEGTSQNGRGDRGSFVTAAEATMSPPGPESLSWASHPGDPHPHQEPWGDLEFPGIGTHSQGPWGGPEPPDWSHGPQLLPQSRSVTALSAMGVPTRGLCPTGGRGGGVAVATSCSQSGDPLPWQCGAQGGKGGAGVMATAARHGDAGGARVGTVMGTQPQHCWSSCSPHSGSHRDPWPCTLGTPCPHTPSCPSS